MDKANKQLHDAFCDELVKIAGVSVQYASAAYFTTNAWLGCDPKALARSYKSTWNL